MALREDSAIALAISPGDGEGNIMVEFNEATQ